MRLLLACLLVSLSSGATAAERIIDFHSEIIVMDDGWIQVTETITVWAEGNRIKRGIYRDFPTEYFDRRGNRYEVDFVPMLVLRNDSKEDWHTQKVDRGVRVYFGKADRFIDTGRHTYTFRYRANRMLGFFENHDELYWNVTGFDWAFPIGRARATLEMDFDVPAGEITHEAYTGPFGSRDREYKSHVSADGVVRFEANEALSALNGLTIVVGWPKGFVAEPTEFQRLLWLLKDNRNLLFAAIGLVLLLVYYIPVWRHFGKDPEEGVIVARYQPPEGFSPASLRYIQQMYYDDKVMTAAVVNLAVKGYLKINASEGSQGFFKFNTEPPQHSLTKLDPDASAAVLAPGERELYESLFAEGKTVVLDNKYHERLGKAKKAHSESLKQDYKQHYFRTNGLVNVPAVLVAILVTLFSVVSGVTLFSVLGIAAMFVMIIFFAIIMKRPTIRGRKLLDEALGFKDYLEVAEKDELNLRNPPAKTPQLFEAYLPYALALGVDQQWAEKFAAVLAAVRGPDGAPYHPAWYNGSWNVANLSASTSQLSSSLNTAITSSVSPPGSSSGGGGGGFSGGGGGGGGGGGW